MLALLRTTSGAQRYWNMARQRYSHQSAPCYRATPVSVDGAASPTPHAAGKARLLDVGGRNPARHGLSAGAEWIRTFSSALDRQQFVVSSEFGADRPAHGHRSSCRPRRTDRVVGRLSGAPPLTARIRRRHTKVALSAVRAHRGTEVRIPPLRHLRQECNVLSIR